MLAGPSQDSSPLKATVASTNTMAATTIMADTKKDAASEDNDAVECLLFKLILLQTLVGEECEIKKGRLSQEF